MKKIISIITALVFVSSIYFVPSVTAITLGELKPDREDSKSVKKGDDAKAVEKKEPVTEKKQEKKDNRVEEEKKEQVNPRLVCLLSVIVPGGGHFYLNNDIKGIGFCLAGGIGYTATGYFMFKTTMADIGSIAFKNYVLLTGFLFFITFIVHFVGIIEAYSDAEELNKQNITGIDRNNPYITSIIYQ